MANVNLKKDFVNGEKLYDYQLNNNFAAIEAALAAMNKIVWQDDEENGAGVSAYKGDTNAIEARDLIDGQLLYNTETGETYIDTYVDDELKRINTGSGNVVAIQDTEPTNEAVKLWIEEDTLDGLSSEVTNEYSESTGLAYSADYINKALTVFGKLLWTGEFTEGSITVPELSNYSIIVIVATGVACFGNATYGVGGYTAYAATSSGIVTYRLEPSGDTLQITDTAKGAYDSLTSQQLSITAIYGLF